MVFRKSLDGAVAMVRVSSRFAGWALPSVFFLSVLTFASPETAWSEARHLRPGQQKIVAKIGGESGRAFPAVATAPLHVRLSLMQGDIDINLIPTEVFTEDAIIRSVGKKVTTFPKPTSIYFVGSSEDAPDSRAYFALMNDGVTGVFSVGGAKYFVEPYKYYDEQAASQELVVTPFDAAQEMLPPDGCGTVERHEETAPPVLLSFFHAMAPLGISSAYALPVPTGDVKLARLVLVGDYDYYHAFGDNEQAAANWLGFLVLLEDATYLRDLGITLRIADVDMLTTATASNSYFPPGISATAFMSRCADYRTAFGHTAAGYAITQCLRGAGQAIGDYLGVAASTGGICGAGGSNGIGATTRPGAGVSSINKAVALMAHENGHVFGSNHLTHSSCMGAQLPTLRCNGTGAACTTNGDCVTSTITCPTNGRCPDTGVFCTTNADCRTCRGNLKDTGYVMWPVLTNPFSGLPLGQCALNQITANIAGDGPYGSTPSSCLQIVHCGDVNRNTVVTASDAQAALQMANCTSNCAYDGLADVVPVPPGFPDGLVTQADAEKILQAAVGSVTLTACGNFPTPYTP